MKNKIIGIMLGLISIVSIANAEPSCPSGQFYDARLKDCVVSRGGDTGNTNGLVTCGNIEQKACTIDDIFDTLNNFAGFILKVIFPGVFLFGIFMVAWPLINQFGSGEPNPAKNAEVKKRLKYLVIGTIFTVGAFLIVKAVLSGAGYKGVDNITNPIDNNATSFIIERAYAQNSNSAGPLNSSGFGNPTNSNAPGPLNSGGFGAGNAKESSSLFLPNPLANVTVQDMILGIANILIYVIIVGAILGIIRGVMYLLLTQENPANLEKGKMWILRSLIAVGIALGAQLIYSIVVNTVSSVFN